MPICSTPVVLPLVEPMELCAIFLPQSSPGGGSRNARETARPYNIGGSAPLTKSSHNVSITYTHARTHARTHTHAHTHTRTHTPTQPNPTPPTHIHPHPQTHIYTLPTHPSIQYDGH